MNVFDMKNNAIPTLETERLILRPWLEKDVQDMFEYGSNPNVALRTGYPPHKDLLDSKKIVYQFLFKEDVFAIELKEENKVIGSVGFHKKPIIHGKNDEEILNREREIGYTLNEKYWGKGYVPEAVKAIMKHCFETLNLKLLRGRCSDANFQSAKVFEKCGFHFDGLIPECEFWSGDGQIHGELFYHCKKEDWAQQNNK